MKRVIQLSLLALVLAIPAEAAVYMKSHTHGTGPNDRPNEAVEIKFEGWFNGERAVLDVLQSNNAMMREGKVFVDGSMMTLYNEEENTCTPWDMQAMMRFAGAMLESMRGVIQLEFGEPELEVLERKRGLSLVGRRVDYLKYRSDWTMSFKAPLMKKRTYDNSTVQEIWYDPRLDDDLPSFGVFMDPESFTTGYEEMDEAIAASMPPIEGAMLKSVAVSQTTNQKGKVETSTTITEVTDLDVRAADPAGGYSPPEDCETVSMFPPTGMPEGEGEPAANAEEDKKPWQKVKVKNPFKRGGKKKDDG